jgi:glycosyltransferase involved in cell wall biosynthesis
VSRRPICYDLTHLVERMSIRAPSGIDRVDLAYARHFGTQRLGPAIHYGIVSPRALKSERIGEVVDQVSQSVWEFNPDKEFANVGATAETEPELRRVLAWLQGVDTTSAAKIRHRQRAGGRRGAELFWAKAKLRLARDGLQIPRNAVYLNVAQLMLEFPWWFRWLKHRSDVTGVFLIHDFLPLDYPEYWQAGYQERFQRRVTTALEHGRAFITTTQVVRDRLLLQLEKQNLPTVPVHVAPLPSPLDRPLASDPIDVALTSCPYFLIVGTIEPRKNHMMLLNVWRQLAAANLPIAKLVIVGSRGWENEQVLDVLDRSRSVRPHVLEIAGVPAATLHRLMMNARAVLLPSFAEGYGLPLVEALSLGVPVVASDIPVFREVGQECAHYLSPLDGVGWRQAIVALSDPSSALSCALRTKVRGFRPPTWSAYFDDVENFLVALK